MTQGWEIKERLDHAVDAVIDSGECGTEPTTVIDFSRTGAGDRPPRGRGPRAVRVAVPFGACSGAESTTGRSARLPPAPVSPR